MAPKKAIIAPIQELNKAVVAPIQTPRRTTQDTKKVTESASANANANINTLFDNFI